MRTMLWLLLLLNGVAALVWMAGFSLPARPVAEPAAPTPSAKRLQLLSELPAPPQRLDSLPLDGVMAADVTDPGSAAEVDTPPPDLAAGNLLAGTAVEPSIVTLAAPVEAAAEPSAPKLALPVTDTPPSTELASTQLGPSAPDMATPPSADAAVCYRTAALAGDAYEAAGALLRQAGLGEVVLQPQDRARSRHWVHWTGSAAAAAEVEERLRAAGVRDWYRLRGADGTVRISLGVYGQADGARRRQRELAAKAIQTQISERYAPQARLRWTVTATAAAVAAASDSLRAQGLQLEACP